MRGWQTDLGGIIKIPTQRASVKALAAKLENLSLIPETYMLLVEN